MKIFIAGASGYLGSQLSNQLSKEHEVYALVRTTSDSNKLDDEYITKVVCDDLVSLDYAFKLHRPKVVINASASYGRKNETLDELIQANIAFPSKLLTLANKYDVQAFIHTGTSLPDSISPYSLTKNTFVKLANFSTERKIKFINLVLEQYYGPNEDMSKFTSYIINQCLSGETLKLTEGIQQRDLIYIKDVISAFNVVIANIEKLDVFESIDIGCGVAFKIKDFVQLIHSSLKSTSELQFGAIGMRDNELMYSCANVARLAQLGWAPNFSLELGIKDMLKRNN